MKNKIMPRRSTAKPIKIDFATKESIGRRISRLRKDRGWSQAQLADQMQISPSVVSANEQDRLKIDWQMLVRYSIVLKISLDELAGIKPTITDKQMLPARLLREFKSIENLAVKEQKVLLKLIHAYIDGLNEANK